MEPKRQEKPGSSGPSEFELIERVRAGLGDQEGLAVGPGDDAAVIEIDGQVVVSVDSMVEGIHFPRGWKDPGDIAHRALAGALSDLAAMAAEPRTVLIALGLPGGTEAEFLEGLADATVEAAGRFGVSVAGGDVVQSPTLFLSVTVIGDLPGGRAPVTRSGAQTGDLVAVTGALGGSAAGLSILTGTEVPGLGPELRDSLISRYLRPTPLTALGVAFGEIGPTAMVDVSDGLVADLGHLASASSVSISIDADAVPIEPGVEAVAGATGRDLVGFALSGGEDYELAMTIDPEQLEALVEMVESKGFTLSVIGRVADGAGVEITSAGRPIEPPPGFEHSF